MNNVQKLNLLLMRAASFNDFDGDKVVDDLFAHEDLWDGAVMDREYGMQSKLGGEWIVGVSLLKLRDIAKDNWSVDTLFITPKAGKEDELEKLARGWNADECDWIGGKEACEMLGEYNSDRLSNKKQILRLWWD